jgi:hypothetical protein
MSISTADAMADIVNIEARTLAGVSRPGEASAPEQECRALHIPHGAQESKIGQQYQGSLT